MNQHTKTVIVTGAAGGMGRETCRHLVAHGWQVVAIDHNQSRLGDLCADQTAIVPLLSDITDEQLSQRLLALLQKLPPVQGLVNMVGVSQGDRIEQLQDEDWEHSFAVNVTPAMRLIRAVSPAMRTQRQGSIVNVGSPVGLIGARKPSYAASKAALQGLTISCARNLGDDGIRVNLLLPGTTITEMTRDWSEVRREQIAQSSFLKRMCTPLEIAEVVAFLLSPASRYITGSIVDMTAGSMWGH